MRTYLGLLLSLLAMNSLGHSTMQSTIPASGSILKASPPQVVINFDEPARLVSVTVARADVADRTLRFTPSGSATSFTIVAPELTKGRSEIKWRALSRDGHPISGSIILVLKPDAP